MCITIRDVHKFIGHCLIPFSPWMIRREMETQIERDGKKENFEGVAGRGEGGVGIMLR